MWLGFRKPRDELGSVKRQKTKDWPRPPQSSTVRSRSLTAARTAISEKIPLSYLSDHDVVAVQDDAP